MISYKVLQDIPAVSVQRCEVRHVPAALRHSRREAAEKTQALDTRWLRQYGCNQPMIAVQNGEGLSLINPDQEDRAKLFIPFESISYRCNLCTEVAWADRLLPANALRHLKNPERSRRKLAPLGSRKDADLLQIRLLDLDLIPLCVRRQLFP